MPLARLIRLTTIALLCCVAPSTAGAQSSTKHLQAAVNRAITGQSGAAVVLDLASSEIIASANLDVAARRLVAPGSTLKPFTLLTLLRARKIDANTQLACKRPLSIGGAQLDCSHPDLRQPMSPSIALAYSCNSYFTTVATRLSPAELRNALLADGFASSTGLAHKEATGSVQLASSQPQLQLQAIGEWGIRVTPLELLSAYARLARLSAEDDNSLRPLFNGLEDAVRFGTAHAAQPSGAMKVAGKTGTSSADEGAWTHAWFAGYAPAEKPRIAVVVFVEKGHGGAEAALIARDIFAAFATEQQSQPRVSGR